MLSGTFFELAASLLFVEMVEPYMCIKAELPLSFF